MMLRLKRAVNILCTLSTSAVLVEGTGIVPFPPAKAISAGIGILLVTSAPATMCLSNYLN
ncbi:hypothetical protein EDB89DRAFT_2015274 [Lactarius sanguifluus]|nr:hypothetical protein EDB89DRAFT_2015274 [Lactarius sanguifluus]